MKHEFRSPYLVQRLEKPHGHINPFSFGGGYKNGGLSDEAMNILKNIFSFDYMGSAEFEWGAVPKAFAELAKLVTDLEIETVGKVFILCPKEYMLQAKDWVRLTAEGKQPGRTKEYVGLERALTDSNCRTCGWLAIDERQPFMFFTNEEMFKNMCKVFGIETEKAVHSGGSTDEGEE